MKPAKAGGLKVLLAEDHRDTNDMYRPALESEGFTVETVESAAALLQFAKERRVDVVVMDLSVAGSGLADILAPRGARSAGPRD